MRELVREAQEIFFRQRNWNPMVCRSCDSLYYAKKYDNTCGSYNCENGYRFLELPGTRNFVHSFELIDPIRRNLVDNGYQEVAPLQVKRRNDERTLFASAAGQILDDNIYKGGENYKRLFCLQPVIRLQSFPSIGKIDGVSTSFVNIGTEQWNASIKEHLDTLDKWLDTISSMGLYVGNMTFQDKSYNNNWGTINVPSQSLKMNFQGLEIGIANYFFNIPRTNGTMSDISVGLERLSWAINKSPCYFNVIGPLEYSLSDNVPYIDSIRTLTLMGGSNVKPGPNNHGSKFRMLAKRVTRPFEMLPLGELVLFYYSQWSRVAHLQIDSNTTLGLIKAEIERQKNIYINQIIGRNNKMERMAEIGLEDIVKDDSRILKNILNIHHRDSL